MSGAVEFSLPPLEALSFLPFIFAQAVLLHPSIPDDFSRSLRMALMIPALYLAAISPFKWRIEPASLAIGSNFRWGIFGPYFIMKAIEWGLAKDRSPYVWVGFDKVESKVERRKREELEAKKSERDQLATVNSSSALATSGSTNPDGSTKLFEASTVNAEDADSQAIEAEAESAEKEEGPWTIFVNSLHLLSSMRGIGYAFGPPLESFGPPAPRDHLPFLLTALSSLIQSHIVSTLALVIIMNRNTNLPRILHTYLFPFSFLSDTSFQPLANAIAYFMVGISLFSQLELGNSGFQIVFLVGTHVLRVILPNSIRPPPFDTRSFPPLFNRPSRPTSVTHFWSSQWHALFRKVFLSVGYEPVSEWSGKIFGKTLGRILGATSVFALSSWMHDQALWSARYGLTNPNISSNLSFTTRYGGHIFFLSQALAVTLEGMISRASRKHRINGGLFATIWSYCWIVGMGLLAARSWMALGLVEGVPEVKDWGWQRWMIPSAALAPPPLFCGNYD